jgi:hypothetical protein
VPVKLGSAGEFKLQNHISKGLEVYAPARDAVKLNIHTKAIRASSIDERIPGGVKAASGAVIGARAKHELIPALLTQGIIGLADSFAAIITNRRPEKLVQTVQSKGNASF